MRTLGSLLSGMAILSDGLSVEHVKHILELGGHKMTVVIDPSVPDDEIHMVDASGRVTARIINVPPEGDV